MTAETDTALSVDADASALRQRRGRLENAWRLLRKAPLTAWFGMAVILAYAIAAIFAPWIAPYKESDVLGDAYEGWAFEVAWNWLAGVLPYPVFSGTDSTYLLGTDQLGRDMFTRLIYGARNSVGIALATTLLSFGIGGTLGMLAAVLRGWTDTVLSFIVDTMMAIPQLIFALMLLSMYGPSIKNIILIIAILDSTRVFRLSRAVGMNVAVMDYVEAASLRGETLRWIIFREILPNILPPMVTEFGMRFCFVFLTISALSFLGMGLQPPTADWGLMVRENATLIQYGDITPLLPAGAIALLTVGVNFVVDWFLHKASGLRDEH